MTEITSCIHYLLATLHSIFDIWQKPQELKALQKLEATTEKWMKIWSGTAALATSQSCHMQKHHWSTGEAREAHPRNNYASSMSWVGKHWENLGHKVSPQVIKETLRRMLLSCCRCLSSICQHIWLQYSQYKVLKFHKRDLTAVPSSAKPHLFRIEKILFILHQKVRLIELYI